MTSKFALVIANTEYQDTSFAKLTAPGRDAEEFAQVLRNLASFTDVQVLLNEGEGKTRRSIARFFAERKRDDLLLLYFSGHGVRNDVGQLFLAANDTEINILEASGIPADFVTQSMNNSRSQRQLLILDCCNSGAFAYGSKSASAVGKSMGTASAFEGSGFGRVVLTATDATQYAWEGDKVIGDTQKSVFTHFLIEGLKGEADRDGDGRIHVDELYDYAHEQVVSRTPKQTPSKWSYKQQGDILLRENLPPREVKPAPLPSDLLELLSHPNSSVRKVGIQDLIGLLNGKHLGLARGAEEKLREIAENDDSFSFRKIASEALTAHGLIGEQPALFKIPEEQKEVKKPIEKPVAKPTSESPSSLGRSQSAPKERQGEGISPRTALDKKKIASSVNYRFFAGITGGLILIALCLWARIILFNNAAILSPDLAHTTQPPIIRTITSTQFFVSITRTPTPPAMTETPRPTTTFLPPETGKDGMTLLYVPSGEFTMGSDDGASDAKPVHTVFLDAFWIDKTEVTVRMYYLCVEAGVCDEPTNISSYTHSSYYGNAEFDDYPVINVDWNMAKTYCEWVDRRLPTEAEWEKAARGETANVYPWGNTFDGSHVNFCDTNCSFEYADKSFDDGFADVAPVGSYPNGASPYGAYDMAGNVWEWVNDWYSETYYSSAPSSAPEGPNSGQYRVLRGGSWYFIGYDVRSAFRLRLDPSVTNDDMGFRCSRSP
ncbi:MAG: SUMF1/EgtB/PvdO family nonheme iron enzyme [Anaerolineales bacterium]|nr:SUMF1/EgtB/PvdO family nonheme iron enzyme [Anaerolineales bacterium]